MGAIRDLWDAIGSVWIPEAFKNWGEGVSDVVDAATIHQLSDRSWSTSVPARTSNGSRIELRGWDDPADETNGVNGKENITDLDVWLDLNEFGITPPWAS